MSTNTSPKSASETHPDTEPPALKRSHSVAFYTPKHRSPEQMPTEQPEQPENIEKTEKTEKMPKISNEALVSLVAEELASHFTERLLAVLKTKSMSPPALLAVIDELHALPQVVLETPTNAREIQIRHMLMLDKMVHAAKNAQEKAKLAWNRTSWERQREANFCVLDGDKQDHEGRVLLDGCGICGVTKTECMKQDEHFGPRGESPPDSVCSHCNFNFCNRYNSAHKLQLHVAEKHAAKE